MRSHSKSYEQYCCIVKKNIVVEETYYHDGKKKLVCTMYPQCGQCGNKILKNNFENCKTIEKR